MNPKIQAALDAIAALEGPEKDLLAILLVKEQAPPMAPPAPVVKVYALTCPKCGNVPHRNAGPNGFLTGVVHCDPGVETRLIFQADDGTFERSDDPLSFDYDGDKPGYLRCCSCQHEYAIPTGVEIGWGS